MSNLRPEEIVFLVVFFTVATIWVIGAFLEYDRTEREKTKKFVEWLHNQQETDLQKQAKQCAEWREQDKRAASVAWIFDKDAYGRVTDGWKTTEKRGGNTEYMLEKMKEREQNAKNSMD